MSPALAERVRSTARYTTGLAVALTLCGVACRRSVVPDAPASRVVQDESQCPAADLVQALADAPSAPVIVMLKADLESAPARQAALLKELGADFQLVRSYNALPGFAGTITRRGYERARDHRDVRCVQLDHPGGGA